MSEWENQEVEKEIKRGTDEMTDETVKESAVETGHESAWESAGENMSEITKKSVDENVSEIVRETVGENMSEITKESVDENMSKTGGESSDRIASWQERAAAENKPLIDNAIFGTDPFEKSNSAEANPWEEPRYGTAENEFGKVAPPPAVQPARGNIPAEPKKSSNKPMIVALALLFGLLIVLCCYVAVTISKGFSGIRFKKDTTYETDSDDPWSEILGNDAKKDGDGGDGSDGIDESTTPQDAADGSDFGLFPKDIFADRSWKEPYKNHKPSEFTGEYYEDFVDCIDDTVPYKIERKFESIEDEKKNICIRASYVQLAGDIPNLDEINRTLKEKALAEYQMYLDDRDYFDTMVEDYNAGIRSDTKSFVTFNDKETLSVAVMYDSNFSYVTNIAVKGVNVNLVTGTVIDNTEILRLDESFGEEFRQRSNKQNGSSYGVELFSNIDIVRMLTDEDSIIIFYTPVGLELGYAYKENGYKGWITISLKDYKKYLNGM